MGHELGDGATADAGVDLGLVRRLDVTEQGEQGRRQDSEDPGGGVHPDPGLADPDVGDLVGERIAGGLEAVTRHLGWTAPALIASSFLPVEPSEASAWPDAPRR